MPVRLERGLLGRLPAGLRFAIYVLVPVSCYGTLNGALFLRRHEQEVEGEKRAMATRASAEATRAQMTVLFQQISIATTQVRVLETALQGMPPEDPLRPAVAAQLREAQSQLARTGDAIRGLGAPPGMSIPSPGTCSCPPSDPFCECIH